MTAINYPITPADETIMKYDLRENRVLQHLRDLGYYKFTIGDILVREDRINWGENKDQWRLNLAECGIPYKYVYVFENELGVGYIRRLSIHGDRFVEAPVCVVNYDPRNIRFKVDPNFADHLLMDTPLDMEADFKMAKKRKEQIYRANEKICEQTKTQAEAIAFLKKLKVGDKIWCGYGRNIEKEPMTVAAVKINLISLDQSTLTFAVRAGQSYEYSMPSIQTKKMYLTRPRFLDETI